MTGYVVMTAHASMPRSCWGFYRRVAVCLVADVDNPPKMISRRARGMIEVARTWERLNVGLTERCAYRRALARAEALAAEMNEYRDRLVTQMALSAKALQRDVDTVLKGYDA